MNLSEAPTLRSVDETGGFLRTHHSPLSLLILGPVPLC